MRSRRTLRGPPGYVNQWFTHDWFTWTTCSRYWFTQRELLLSSRVASVVRSEALWQSTSSRDFASPPACPSPNECSAATTRAKGTPTALPSSRSLSATASRPQPPSATTTRTSRNHASQPAGCEVGGARPHALRRWRWEWGRHQLQPLPLERPVHAARVRERQRPARAESRAAYARVLRARGTRGSYSPSAADGWRRHGARRGA